MIDVATELSFSPLAWAKLNVWRDKAPTLEVGCWGYTPDDLMQVTDLVLVKQKVSSVRVEFNMEHVAETMHTFADKYGVTPDQWLRVWVHTHPFDSCEPSSVDETTWDNLFDTKSSGVMVIVSETDRIYARAVVRADGVALVKRLKVVKPLPRKWGRLCTDDNVKKWEEEYDELVSEDSGWRGYRTPFKWEEEKEEWPEAASGQLTFGKMQTTDLVLSKIQADTEDCRKYLRDHYDITDFPIA